MVLLELFWSFLKIGFTSFGGLSMIPLINDEVLSHGWMTASEVADIVAIDVDEELLDAAGRLQLEKADLLAYAHGDYYALGRRLGSFGWSVRKKKPRR